MDARNPTIQLERSNADAAQRQSLLATLSWSQIAKLVRTEADGLADPNELEQLASDPIRWRNVLTDMIEDLEDRMHSIRRLKGPQRKQVIIDFEGEFTLLTDAYERLPANHTASTMTLTPHHLSPSMLCQNQPHFSSPGRPVE